ncbi:MAG TPA: PaaI family thioesterase [Ktedonobacteraceae bacterium]|jgi:acyl-coenzyme A thioesterase PaaI-like protein|nr:PaaI family thioesterase [Ktedonobacteraceae bacterium]
MELNDNSDYQQCFVCGLRNPYGLQMVFRQEGDFIVSDFRPKAEHQGFPGVIHGGIVASVLDETLNRTCALSKNPAWSMTGRLEVRYRQYVPFGPLLRVRAKLDNERGRLLQASGSITLADDESKVLAEAQATFMALSPEMGEMLMRDHPEMKDFFKNQV